MDAGEHEFNKSLQALKTDGSNTRPGWRCPSAERLGSYFEGTLSTTEARRIARHLGRCDFCAHSLDIIASSIRRSEKIQPLETARSRVSAAAVTEEALSSLDARIESIITRHRSGIKEMLRRMGRPGPGLLRPRYSHSLAFAFSALLVVAGAWALMQQRTEFPRGADVAIYSYTPSGVKGPSTGLAGAANEIRPGDLVRVDIPDEAPEQWWQGIFIDSRGRLHDALIVPPLSGVSSATLRTDADEEPYVRLQIGEGVKLLEIPAGRFFRDRSGSFLAAFLCSSEPIPRSSLEDLVELIRTLWPGTADAEASTLHQDSLLSDADIKAAETTIREWGSGKIVRYDIDSLYYQTP